MLNAGLAGAITRLILTRNHSGHKTDWEVGNWEKTRHPGGGSTAKSQVSRYQVRDSSGVNSTVQSTHTFIANAVTQTRHTPPPPPPAGPPTSGILTGMPTACGETVLTTVCLSGTRWQLQFPLPSASSSLLCLLCLFSLD